MGKNKEQKMMTFVSKAKHYIIGKEYEKAIEYYKKAIEIDKPYAKEIGIVEDYERTELLLIDQKNEPIRGLGILYLDVLDLAGNYVNIHRVFITEQVRDDMRLPVMPRTRFVKAKSMEELEEGILIVDAETKLTEEANQKIIDDLNKNIKEAKEASDAKKSESDVIIKDLNEKLIQAGGSLKKAEKTTEGQTKVIDELQKRLKILEKEGKF